MTRRVRWRTTGVGALAGLDGFATVRDRDVAPVTACLRDLQGSAGGLAVVDVDPLSSDAHRVAYAVTMARAGAQPVACILVLEREQQTRSFEASAAGSSTRA